MRTILEIGQQIEDESMHENWRQQLIDSLYTELAQVINDHRDKWDDENYSTPIDCPSHLSHKARLFTYGHKHAGAWECPDGNVGVCSHYDREMQDTEDEEGVKDKIYVCSMCLITLEGDPKADEAEAKAEMQMELSREN